MYRFTNFSSYCIKINTTFSLYILLNKHYPKNGIPILSILCYTSITEYNACALLFKNIILFNQKYNRKFRILELLSPGKYILSIQLAKPSTRIMKFLPDGLFSLPTKSQPFLFCKRVAQKVADEMLFIMAKNYPEQTSGIHKAKGEGDAVLKYGPQVYTRQIYSLRL